jgi:hypothetical protein
MDGSGDEPDWIDAMLRADASERPVENDPDFVARVMQALPVQHRLDIIALLAMGLSAAACAFAEVFLTDHRLELVQTTASSLGSIKLETVVSSLLCCLVFSGLAGLSYHLACDPDAF